MRECSQCGSIKDTEEFLPKNERDRKNGVLTRMCQSCRDRNNRYKRHWYATVEKERISQAT